MQLQCFNGGLASADAEGSEALPTVVYSADESVRKTPAPLAPIGAAQRGGAAVMAADPFRHSLASVIVSGAAVFAGLALGSR